MVLLRLNLPTADGRRQDIEVGFRDLLMWRQAMGLPSSHPSAEEAPLFQARCGSHTSRPDTKGARRSQSPRKAPEVSRILGVLPDRGSSVYSNRRKDPEEEEIARHRAEALEILEGKRVPRRGSCPIWIICRLEAKEKAGRTQAMRRRRPSPKDLGGLPRAPRPPLPPPLPPRRERQPVQKARNVRPKPNPNARTIPPANPPKPPKPLDKSSKTPRGVIVVPGPHGPKRTVEAGQTPAAGPVSPWETLRRVLMDSLWGSDRRPFRTTGPHRAAFLLVTKLAAWGERVVERRELATCSAEEFRRTMEGVEERGWRDVIWVAGAGEEPPRRLLRSKEQRPKVMEWGKGMF